MSHPRLMEFYDRELNPEERNEVEVHLRRCRPCRRQLEEWRAVDGLVRGDPPRRRQRPSLIWLQAAVLLLTAGFAVLQVRPTLPLRDKKFAQQTPEFCLSKTPRRYEIHHGAQTYTVETSGSNTTLLMLEVEDEEGLAQAHIGGENL